MRKQTTKKIMIKDVNLSMRKFILIAALAAMATLIAAGSAFAFTGHPLNQNYWDTAADNRFTTAEAVGGAGCAACHSEGGHGGYAGPHGGYTTETTKCATCHVIHSQVGSTGVNPANAGLTQQLLPGVTVTGACNACHDLTGAQRAPYYTSYMTNETEVQSAHYVEGATVGKGLQIQTGGEATSARTATSYVATSVYSAGLRLPVGQIPGGDAATGGAGAYDFKEGNWSLNNATSQFTCDSCHTPHAVVGSTVNAYFGESYRKGGDPANTKGALVAGSRLLKDELTAGNYVYNYGSAWCAGCHQGRLTMTSNNSFNHPVNPDGPGYSIGTVMAYGVFNSSTTKPSIYTGTYANEDYSYLAGLSGDALKNAIDAGVLQNTNSEDGGLTQVATWLADHDTNGNLTTSMHKVKLLPFGAEGTVVAGGDYDPVAHKYNVYAATNPMLSAMPNFNTWYTMTAGDPLSNNAPRPDGYIPISQFTKRVNGVNQADNGPSCQQCHASPRDVEAAFAGTGAPETSFPHISTNKFLLVQADTDDLCTNCHGLDNLP